ncbi:membrane-spanning 4-domains subfamily A member 8 isoform X2 [Ochotona curzoniae]|uniref:membrane-spanning 4-domains subfamily A member 8 isoform X2 n=1 Tax=Ochotona curzoniae TaxID=130825 RepID=UPI001B346E7B|nr:membrane-spanning 4-domains subfamily A member 8 isoform X2 [Ochotona curzoniae]
MAKEIRTLGAIQVMIGLINFAIGYLWLRLFTRQYNSFTFNYTPVILFTGYPFWSFLFYVTSGVLAIAADRRHTPLLLGCTIRTNINSGSLSLVAQILIIVEIILVAARRVKIQWTHRSGMILSSYLWVFSWLEMTLAWSVARWGIEETEFSALNI